MVPTIDDLLSGFGIEGVDFDAGATSLRQFISPTLADHRGRIEFPAYAVTVESATSGAFWHSFGAPVGSVQSWLALTTAAAVDANQRLTATAKLIYRDNLHGSVSVHVADEGDRVVCAGVGRCVRVGRTSDALTTIDHAVTRELDTVPDPAALPPPIDPALDGKQILAAISDGAISAGPLCDLLCVTVTLDDGSPQLTVAPQPWMANPLGAMQGGVVTTIVAQACSLAGQLYTDPGQQYSLVDFSINFFRSPPVEAEDLTVITTLDKLGRRIGTVSAIMSGPDDVQLARAVADIQYD